MKLLQPVYLTAIAKFRKVAKLCDKAILRFEERTPVARKVKIVNVRYGPFGNPNNRKIEKAIEKWLKKGYRLESQLEQPRGFLFMRTGLTRLTFIKE